MSGFASRLSPEEFSSDARTAVFLEWPARAERTERIAELWVPERLFERLVHLGAAYELHFAQLINLRRESWLEGRQCESLAYELELVLDLVPGDQALRSVVGPLLDMAVRASHEALGLRFTPSRAAG